MSTELLHPQQPPLAAERLSVPQDCASEPRPPLQPCRRLVLNETVMLGQIKVQQKERGL